MKLMNLPMALLVATGLLAGVFAVAPAARADECKENCGDGGDASVIVDGGTVANTTAIDISADGGVAVADASGGDLNVATAGNLVDGVGDGTDTAVAGNGGVAAATANGGSVVVGDINTGGNSGNTIVVGNTGGDDDGECKKDCEPKCEKDCEPKCEKDCNPCKDCGGGTVVKKPTTTITTTVVAKGATTVARLPATGVGAVRGERGANDALSLLAALGALGAAGYGLRRRVA